MTKLENRETAPKMIGYNSQEGENVQVEDGLYGTMHIDKKGMTMTEHPETHKRVSIACFLVSNGNYKGEVSITQHEEVLSRDIGRK